MPPGHDRAGCAGLWRIEWQPIGQMTVAAAVAVYTSEAQLQAAWTPLLPASAVAPSPGLRGALAGGCGRCVCQAAGPAWAQSRHLILRAQSQVPRWHLPWRLTVWPSASLSVRWPTVAVGEPDGELEDRGASESALLASALNTTASCVLGKR